MKRKFISKKIKWVVSGCCLVFIACLVVYFSGVLGNKKISSVVSFVTETAHTGLINTPASQVAFNDQNKTSNQFASNPKSQAQGGQSGGQQVATGNGIPNVLFDISIQPFSEKITHSALYCGRLFLS